MKGDNPLRISLRFSLFAAIALAVTTACNNGGTDPTPTATIPTATASAAAPTTPAGQALTVFAAGTDYAVGPNRFAFAAIDAQGDPIRTPQASATFVFLDTEPIQARAQAVAEFVSWPAGTSGVYVTQVNLDAAGRWGIIITVKDASNATLEGTAGFEVKAESPTPSVGERPPASVNKTARSVSDLTKISTSISPDADLYQMTIAEAMESGKPTIVTFATPAYCTSATCGPQVDIVSEVKDDFKGRVNFIHVEVYDNPDEIQGDLKKAVLSPVLREWGLPSEPYTFILDEAGLVAAKYEGFVTKGEMKEGLNELLGN